MGMSSVMSWITAWLLTTVERLHESLVPRATRDRGVSEIKEQFIKLELAEEEKSAPTAATDTKDDDKGPLFMDLESA
jgi:hypothetical protein